MTTSKTEINRSKRYVHLPYFLCETEQMDLAQSALQCHSYHSIQTKRTSVPISKKEVPTIHNDSTQCSITDTSNHTSVLKKLKYDEIKESKSSLKLNLGLDECGGDLYKTLPLSVEFARKAFREAGLYYKSNDVFEVAESLFKLAGELPSSTSTSTSTSSISLTGLGLLYGPNAIMSAHYDSSTQPGQREEWLVMFTIGSDVLFRCNDVVLTLTSGDALVMDSMSVLHGVEGIRKKTRHIATNNKQFSFNNETDMALHYGLPVEGSRLGILLWQGRAERMNVKDKGDSYDDNISMEALSDLFQS